MSKILFGLYWKFIWQVGQIKINFKWYNFGTVWNQRIEKYWLYIFIIRANQRRFLEDFWILFWPKPSLKIFLGHYPFFRESIFRISIFQFSNDLILNLRIINFRSSKSFWLIEFPRFRILKNFLIFGEYNWPLNFAQNPKSCMTSSTFRHECYHSDVMSDVIRVTSWFAIFPVKFCEFVREN